MCVYTAHHSLAPPIVSCTLGYLCSFTVVSKKRDRKILEILWSLCGSAYPYFIEYRHRDTFRVIIGLSHDESNRTDQYSFCYTTLSVFCSVTDYFAATG